MEKGEPTPDLSQTSLEQPREDFRGKYQEKNPISRYLVREYFRSVGVLLKRVPRSGPLTALEIGCGEGHSTQRIVPLLQDGDTLEASEYLQAQVEVASRINAGVKIQQEDVYALQRESKSIDLIFLLEVLEHLEHPQKALAEIRRVSRAHLILGVPREPMWRVLNMCRGKYWSAFGNTPGHLNHWSSSGIIRLIEKEFGPVIAVEKPVPWTIVLATKS